MNTFVIRLASVVIALLLYAGAAEASLVLVGPLNPVPSNANPENELAAIQSQYPGNDFLLFFARWSNEDEAIDFTDGIAGSGTFDLDPPGNVSFSEVEWNMNGLYELSYVLVKGGNVWNLYSVTADQVKDSITPQDIYVEADGSPAISHVSFFGVVGTGVIPEPGTMAVWGMLAVTGYFGAKKWHATKA